MSLNPAKCRVEIFREPGFFDDNWQKGWSIQSGGTSGWDIQDGEKVVMNAGDQTYCTIDHTLNNIDTNVYTKLEVRVLYLTDFWNVYVYDGTGWIAVWSANQNASGFLEATLPAAKTLTAIRICSIGTNSTTHFDYVAISKNGVLIPDLGDLVEELTVSRPLLNNGIAGAKLSIPNFASAYNGLIKNQDSIIIWLARDKANLGVPAYYAGTPKFALSLASQIIMES